MRILYVAMADDYGDPSRGPSFEETNFRSALDGMGHEVIPFDFMAERRDHGKGEMNRRLLAAAEEASPDLSFFVLFEDEIDTGDDQGREPRGRPDRQLVHGRPLALRPLQPALRSRLRLVDHDRPRLAAQVRGDRLRAGRSSPSGPATATPTTGRPTDSSYDVTFIGQSYGERPATVERLRAEGFDVRCWGFGWPEGRIEHDEMVRVFGASRINLNLSSAFSPRGPAADAGAPPDPRDEGGPQEPDQGPHLRGARAAAASCSRITSPTSRTTSRPGKEIGVFESPDDLVDPGALVARARG